MFLLQLKKSSFFESSILTGCALLFGTWTFFAVRSLKEISGVLRNSLERRRGGILWPDKEEENIIGKIQLNLRTTQQPPDKYLEAHKRAGGFTT